MTDVKRPTATSTQSVTGDGPTPLASSITAPQVDPATFRLAMAATVGACIVLAAFFGRQVFLFSDDYVFLRQAKDSPFGWDYLADPLFSHFSPVSRAVDSAVVNFIPGNPELIFWVLLLFAAVLLVSVAVLMTSLFQRSWTSIVGTAWVGSSLTLLPLMNWWTAGVNIMPALAGAAVTFAGMVNLVRGRSRWWALPAVLGYLVAVLSWELGASIPFYALLWTLLFRARVTTQPLLAVLRRTWWVWSLLVVIGGLTVVNYRLNYYTPSAFPSWPSLIDGLSISLFKAQLPMALGIHDELSQTYTTFGVIAGIAALGVLLIVTLIRSGRAWRGWVFALAGWFVPSFALVAARVGEENFRAPQQPVYFFLPTLLLAIGVLEAWVAPRRRRSAATVQQRPGRIGRGIGVTAAIATTGSIAVCYVISSGPTIASLFNYGVISSTGTAPMRSYVPNLLASAERIRATSGDFSVIDQTAPSGLVFPGWAGHNRLSQVIGLSEPDIAFDDMNGPYYRADETGTLQPVVDQPVSSSDLTVPPGADSIQVSGFTGLFNDSVLGTCFEVADPGSRVLVPLPEPVPGGQLFIRTMVSVDRPTSGRLTVVAPDGVVTPTTSVGTQWLPDQPGSFDAFVASGAESVMIDSLPVGARLCLASVKVGMLLPQS